MKVGHGSTDRGHPATCLPNVGTGQTRAIGARTSFDLEIERSVFQRTALPFPTPLLPRAALTNRIDGVS